MDNTIRVEDELEDAVNRKDLRAASRTLTQMSPHDVVGVIERSSLRRAAVIFRLLSKERALQVFDGLGHTMQSELFRGLRDEDVAALFAELQPDDRVGLIDELPAVVAQRALTGVSPHERAMTMVVLGYPAKSVGRRMSPEYVRTHPDLTIAGCAPTSTFSRCRSSTARCGFSGY